MIVKINVDHYCILCCVHSAVVTFLAGTSTINVFRILKQKGGSITLSDATVEFPKVCGF